MTIQELTNPEVLQELARNTKEFIATLYIIGIVYSVFFGFLFGYWKDCE